jgi:alpha-tubulin suppressor-like RCC1 family protein
VAVSGLGGGVIEISANAQYTCALTGAGGVECWGFNMRGQLGNGSTADSSTPVPVSGLESGVIAISTGDYHACALTSAAAVECWGADEAGQLGDGKTKDRSTPVEVAGLSSSVTAISAGYQHTCALTSAGGVECWGANDFGTLGNGTTDDSSSPVEVAGLPSGITAISAGDYHTCALTSAGGVMCWGANDYGQLGDGTSTSASAAVAVVGLDSGVTAISAGFQYTCALTSAGDVMCWGINDYGQLGDGTTESSATPVAVSGL